MIRTWRTLFCCSSVSFSTHGCVPAVEPLQLEMGVEVQHNALGGFRGCDYPFAVLVRRVLQRVTRRSDITRISGINVPTTLLTYEEEIEREESICLLTVDPSNHCVLGTNEEHKSLPLQYLWESSECRMDMFITLCACHIKQLSREQNTWGCAVMGN